MDVETKKEIDKIYGKFVKKGAKTKEEIKKIYQKLAKQEERFAIFYQWTIDTFVTKEELQAQMDKIDKKFEIVLDSLDEMVTEMRASRNDRLLQAGQFVDLDDKVANHERRIVILERR